MSRDNIWIYTMKQFELNKQYSYSMEKEELITKSKDFLFGNSFKIVGETNLSNGHSIHAQRGSETALRLLGALLTTKKQLPIKINIKIMNDNTVDFFITSDIVGIGSSFGLKNKFNNCFNEILNLYQNVTT